MAKDKNIDIRPQIFFRNYDYSEPVGKSENSPGGGLYHGKMDKFKSVKDFLDKARKKRRKKKLASILHKVAADKDYKELLKINIRQLKDQNPKTDNVSEKDYYENLALLAKEGPVFSKTTLSFILNLNDRHLPEYNRKGFVKWLANYVEVYNNTNVDWNLVNDLTVIKDFVNQTRRDMSPTDDWFDIVNEAKEWHESEFFNKDDTGGYKTKDVVYDFGNGYTIVKVPPEDLEVEGIRMQHCVKGYCDVVESGKTTIYSLRDSNNKPHATIEVSPSNYIYQIKGKQNRAPVEKYAQMVIEWVEKNFDKENYDSSDFYSLLSENQLIDRRNDENYKIREEAARRLPEEYLLDMLKEGDDNSASINIIINRLGSEKMAQLLSTKEFEIDKTKYTTYFSETVLRGTLAALAGPNSGPYAQDIINDIFIVLNPGIERSQSVPFFSAWYGKYPNITNLRAMYIKQYPMNIIYSHEMSHEIYGKFKDLLRPIYEQVADAFVNKKNIPGFGGIDRDDLNNLFGRIPVLESMEIQNKYGIL